MIISFIISAVIALFLVVCGIMFLRGRWENLLAGWNTMSETERAKWNKDAMFRFTGWMLIIMSVPLFLLPLVIHYELTALIWVMIGLMTAIPVVGAIYMNVSKRFLNQKEPEL